MQDWRLPEEAAGNTENHLKMGSFCMTMQELMQWELWLICWIAGEVLYQPFYSTDLSPYDYDLIAKIK